MTPRLLIVEDEAAIAALLRYNFEREGFEVSEAMDGEEALLRAQEDKPDLVVLDWMLPLMSGIEVCRRLRRLPETRAVPIVMLTARGEEADKVRRLKLGADDYVTNRSACWSCWLGSRLCCGGFRPRPRIRSAMRQRRSSASGTSRSTARRARSPAAAGRSSCLPKSSMVV